MLGSVENDEHGHLREDGRPVAIPRSIALACSVVALEEAIRLSDPSMIKEEAPERAMKVCALLQANGVLA